MIKDDCIFCKLANGVFPTNTVYEDDDFRVILDASPAAKGHSLIIPKQHSDNLYSTDDETLAKILPLAKKIAASMKKTFNCDGVNIIQNNEPAAGQTVFHLHVHAIPRFNDDNVGIGWPQNETDADEQVSIAKALADNID
ncbi:MAG: HIT family protein [Eubacterium sp.]|nr:HIT family protein [Eubacterium sp.]